MVILEDPPEELIRGTTQNFHIQPDKAAIERINDALDTIRDGHETRLRDQDNALRKLARTLASLNTQHADLISSHSPTTHASEIASLDTSKFRIAKSASDHEIEAERLSSQLLDLQSRLQELELQGADAAPANHGIDSDLTSLRLKVYRSLGCSVDGKGEGGEGGEGEYNRMIVRNITGKADVHIVRVGKEEGTRAFTANFLWDRM